MWAYFRLIGIASSIAESVCQHPPATQSASAPGGRTQYALPGGSISSCALDRKRTLQVRISVPNPYRLLRPGCSVRVIVPALDSPEAIRIRSRRAELQNKRVLFAAATMSSQLQSLTSNALTEWVVASGLSAGDRSCSMEARSAPRTRAAGCAGRCNKSRSNRSRSHFFHRAPCSPRSSLCGMILSARWRALACRSRSTRGGPPPCVGDAASRVKKKMPTWCSRHRRRILEQQSTARRTLYMSSKIGNDGTLHLTLTSISGIDKN